MSATRAVTVSFESLAPGAVVPVPEHVHRLLDHPDIEDYSAFLSVTYRLTAEEFERLKAWFHASFFGGSVRYDELDPILCTSCGQKKGDFIPSLNGVYCLRCAAEQKRHLAARNDLKVMLEPMVGLWRTHWMALGVTEEEALELIKDVPTLFGYERVY